MARAAREETEAREGRVAVGPRGENEGKRILRSGCFESSRRAEG